MEHIGYPKTTEPVEIAERLKHRSPESFLLVHKPGCPVIEFHPYSIDAPIFRFGFFSTISTPKVWFFREVLSWFEQS
jgi:hypothetical protein